MASIAIKEGHVIEIYGGIASAELSENNRIRLQIAARGAIALG